MPAGKREKIAGKINRVGTGSHGDGLPRCRNGAPASFFELALCAVGVSRRVPWLSSEMVAEERLLGRVAPATDLTRYRVQTQADPRHDGTSIVLTRVFFGGTQNTRR